MRCGNYFCIRAKEGIMFKAGLFQNKAALVTGGGSGIGLRIARDLLSYGARVAILGRDAAKLEAARKSDGMKDAHAIVCNLREDTALPQVMDEIRQALGGLDILVNNAGGQFPGGTEQISPKGFRAVVDTNLTGTFLVTKSCFENFFKKSGGAIVNILMDMRNGMPLMPHSAAARAGVDNLTKSWAVEWAHYGVRVNAVAPGIIRSSGLDTYAPEFRKIVEGMALRNYAYRAGTESEVSQAVLFLASAGASYITGQTLFVDGGESIYSPFLPPREHRKLPPHDADST